MKKILLALLLFGSLCSTAQLIPQYLGNAKTQIIARGPFLLPPAIGTPDSIGSLGRIPGSLNLAFFNGDAWIPLASGPTWTLKAIGISPGTGNKGAALQAAFSAGSATTIWAEEQGIIPLGQSVNGTSKNLKVESGTKFTNGAISNVYLEAPKNAYVIDTSVASTNFTNTDIYAANYGFLPSASAAQNTRAAQRISALINSKSGGVNLWFEQGTYIVGKETFANGGGKGYSYTGTRILFIENCTKPVVINGNGAIIKLADSLHFGSFNPTTGAVYTPPNGGFVDANYAASLRSLCWFENNASLTVRNITLDGNIGGAIVGGYFGDQGYQLEADGVVAINNGELNLEGVNGIRTGRDGFYLANTTTQTSAIRKVNLRNCIFDSNVRQGLSFTGGNHLYAINCFFINTGRTVNNRFGGAFYSSPAAGLDIESEVGLTKNAVFDNCTFENNTGAAVVNDNGSLSSDIAFRNCKAVGTTAGTIYGLSKRMKWESSVIVGQVLSLYTPGSTGYDDPDNAIFTNCLFTMDSTLSKNGQVFGTFVMDLGGGGNASFDNCTIDSRNRASVYGGFGMKWTDCTFIRDTIKCLTCLGDNYLKGHFFGTNRLQTVHGIQTNPNTLQDDFQGPFYISNLRTGALLTDLGKLAPDSIRKSIIRVNTIANGYELIHNDGSKKDTIDASAKDSIVFDAADFQKVGVFLQVKSYNVSTLAVLRTKKARDSTSGTTAGYYTRGDGGGSRWYFDSTSTTADDSATVIGSGTGRWKAIFEGGIRPEQFGAFGNGTANDTRAVQKAINYCSLRSKTLLPSPANFYAIFSTVDIVPQSGSSSSYTSFNITGSGLQNAAIFRWKGGDSTAMFRIRGLKNSAITTVNIDLGTGYRVVAWDIATDDAHGSTSFVSFKDCQVGTGGGTGNQGKYNVAWRLGHISTDASGDISEYAWYNCIVSGSDKVGSTGWLQEGGNTVGLKWYGGYGYNLDYLYSNFGTAGATMGSGGGGAFFYGLGGHVCNYYFAIANIGNYHISGGRFEGGGRFLHTASAAHHPIVTIEGADLSGLSGINGRIIYVDAPATVHMNGVRMESTGAAYGTDVVKLDGFANEGDFQWIGGAVSSGTGGYITYQSRWHVFTRGVGRIVSTETPSYYPNIDTDVIAGEVLTGTINGTNTTFTSAYAPASSTDKIFYNGVRQFRGVDYTVSGNTYTFAVAPTSGRIIIDYNR